MLYGFWCIYREGGSFLNARKLSFYNAVFRLFFNAQGVISQRARLLLRVYISFVRAAVAFILQPAMVLTFCSPGFWVSWFLGLLVSGFLGFLVSWFLGLLVSRLFGFSVSWLLRLLVSWLLRLLVSWFLGLLVSRFLVFLLSEFLVWVLNVTP